MTTPAERLRQAREAAGYTTAKSAAEAMGVSVPTYIQHENGSRGLAPPRAERYGRFFRATPEWLLYGRGEGPGKSGGIKEPSVLTPISRFVPLLGVVQAGVWAEIPEQQPEPEEMLPILLPGFEGAQLYALRVRGSSMDKFYPDNSLVIVCPAVEIGVRDGDHVVVRRKRGMLVETTIKEIAQEKGGIALWPRSFDPNFQDPIRLQSVRDADEGPEVIAVVVSTYVIRPMQQKPLIQL